MSESQEFVVASRTGFPTYVAFFPTWQYRPEYSCTTPVSTLTDLTISSLCFNGLCRNVRNGGIRIAPAFFDLSLRIWLV